MLGMWHVWFLGAAALAYRYFVDYKGRHDSTSSLAKVSLATGRHPLAQVAGACHNVNAIRIYSAA